MGHNKPKLLESSIREVQFGENITIIKPVNIYECSIGDNCFVGPFVEIQKGVEIGRNTKIQSHSFICELVTVGDNCFISHGVKFVNDLFKTGHPAGGDTSKWEKTIVGNSVSIGTNATVLPVKICDNVVIGAGAVVTKDIINPGIYAGNPARLIRILKG